MERVSHFGGVAVAVEDAKIAAVGRQPDVIAEYPDHEIIDCSGCILTPGLVDSHTHAIFGRHRAEEQEMRAGGMEYMEIGAQGGGIHQSVQDLKERSDEQLIAQSLKRLNRMASYGTTTVEIKSGYGLSTEQELRTLRIARELQARSPVRIVPTWLGAHEVPLEFRERSDGRAQFMEVLLNEMLPVVAREKLALFADVFCEPGVFSIDESRTILTAARAAGLGLKLHADELHYSGGAELAAELRATSADHLAAISPEGIIALSHAEVIATLLPGTMLFLGRTSRAPGRRIIEYGGAVALATDFNPGTSPTVNLPLIMTLGEGHLGLSAAECLVAVTVNGAAAVGLAGQTGQIAPGFDADLAIFEAEHFRELPYWYGDRLCRGSWSRGKACYQFELPIRF